MEIILAVVAVIIIAAIAFIVWRSKQSPTTPQVLQPTLDNTTPVTPAPTTAASPTPQPNLDIAQALIDEQRYDEATAIIKKQLIANPKDAHAMFKLLQIYGLTENFAAFRQLHDKIRASGGDTAIIAQADELSSLLQPTPAPAVVATPSTSPVADSLESGLDFSTENTQGATSDDGLDFFSDSAELNLSDTANETQASTQDSSLDLDNGDFSLDFDEPASSAQPSNTHGLSLIHI